MWMKARTSKNLSSVLVDRTKPKITHLVESRVWVGVLRVYEFVNGRTTDRVYWPVFDRVLEETNR